MSAQPLIVDPLFFFNQRASQLESTVAWVEVPTGLSHSRQWSVECLVDGAVCGAGEGRDKKSAKRLAAAQALQVLNWIPSEETTAVPMQLDGTAVTDLESYVQEKDLSIFWGYDRVGEHNMVSWNAYCFVGDELKGKGVGPSKVFAQRQAAMEATASMLQPASE